VYSDERLCFKVFGTGERTAEPNMAGVSAHIIEIISYTGLFAEVFITC